MPSTRPDRPAPPPAAPDTLARPWRAGWRWPTLCEVCRRWAHQAVCPDCLAHYQRPGPRCGGCGLRLNAAAARCGHCLKAPEPFAAGRCAVDYAFPWDRLLADFKFHGRVELASPLATLMLGALSANDRQWPDLVVPVPMAPGRLAGRGYNQAWELARRVGRAIDRPARADLLRRPLDRAPQAGLDRLERQRNLRGVFEAPASPVLAGRQVALVDDVLTTGATAAEATRALLAGGASAVTVWTLARTA